MCGRVDGGVQSSPTPAGLFNSPDGLGGHAAGLHSGHRIYDNGDGRNLSAEARHGEFVAGD